MRPSPNGFWLSVCIAKVIGISDHWVASTPRSAFEGLELCDGKLWLWAWGQTWEADQRLVDAWHFHSQYIIFIYLY